MSWTIHAAAAAPQDADQALGLDAVAQLLDVLEPFAGAVAGGDGR